MNRSARAGLTLIGGLVDAALGGLNAVVVGAAIVGGIALLVICFAASTYGWLGWVVVCAVGITAFPRLLKWFNEQLVEKRFSSAEALRQHGEEKLRNGDCDGAIVAFGRALKRGASWPSSCFLGRAQARIGKGDYAGAIADCQEAFQADGNCTDALRLRGIASEQLGDRVSALSDFEFVLQREPDNAALYLRRALLWLEDGFVDRAHTDLSFATEAEPPLPDAEKSAALTLCGIEDAWSFYFKRAVLHLNAALDVQPGDATSLLARGCCLYANQSWREALRDFRRACDLETEVCDKVYAAVFAHCAEGKLGSAADGRRRIEALLGAGSPAAWEQRLAMFFLDQIDEGALAASFASHEGDTEVSSCELHCFVGLKHAIRGNREEAISHLLSSVADRWQDVLFQSCAYGELLTLHDLQTPVDPLVQWIGPEELVRVNPAAREFVMAQDLRRCLRIRGEFQRWVDMARGAITQTGLASIGMLQIELGISTDFACAILTELEAQGAVSKAQADFPRDVLDPTLLRMPGTERRRQPRPASYRGPLWSEAPMAATDPRH